MGAYIKTLRNRIKSVNSTLQLTKAMGLAASAKIHRANISMQAASSHEQAVRDVLFAITSSGEAFDSPFTRTDNSRTRMIVISGDRGLAGGYNANIFRLAAQFPDAELIPIGFRACERYGKDLVSSEHFTASFAYETAERLCKDFAENKYDKLGIICTKYISVMTQEAVVKQIFPLKSEKKSSPVCPVFEPNASDVLNAAVYEYVTAAITAAVRESFACEVAARRTAMDSAEKNARKMTDSLQLEYNRARQGAITQEITEIVAGSGS